MRKHTCSSKLPWYCAVRSSTFLWPVPMVCPKNQPPNECQDTGISRRISSCNVGVVTLAPLIVDRRHGRSVTLDEVHLGNEAEPGR